MIDRSVAPVHKEIKSVNLDDYELKYLSNGIPVYIFNTGSQNIVSIEIMFDAGSFNQSKPLVASCTNALLMEGTSKYSSQQINEAVDFYGAFLQTDISKDVASIALYALNKQLHNVLPYLKEVLLNPTFPEHELQTHLSRIKQQFLVNLEKNSSIARREFLNVLYGDKHPYGRKAKVEFFDQIYREDLVQFWAKNYTSKNCKIFLAGKITAEVFKSIDSSISLNNLTKPSSAKKFKHFIEKPNSVQSAIRIGKRTIGKSHHDFAKLQVVNTILGGYFGSRLMSNIREDKGYTYGIGSFISPQKHDSYFGISTEVGADMSQKAISEIYKEIEFLRTTLVSDLELNLVKSYLMGELLKSVDGPFSLAERWKGIILFDLDKSYFDSLTNTILNITPFEVRDIAEKYLGSNDLYEVVVGSNNMN